MTTQTLTPEARRAFERERVDAACKALLTSEGWRRWVRARSVFRSYSFNNQLLIALQAPEASRVAGFQAWRTLGRQVRKGETSIRIYAPMPYRKELKLGEEELAMRFRAVPSSTSPRPTPSPASNSSRSSHQTSPSAETPTRS